MFGLVAKREVEERMGRRPSYTVSNLVQTIPGGWLKEAGRIDYIPPVGVMPEDLHWHQRDADNTDRGLLPLVSGGNPLSAIENKLQSCREWIAAGGFQVDDEFSDDEHAEFVSCCMTQLATLMSLDSK